MKKKTTSLKLAQRSVSNKVEYARAIVRAMTGNPKFPAPSPGLAVISTAATDLENAITEAMDGGKSKIAAMRAKEKLLDDLLRQLGKYVDATANGDESIILSAGIDASADKTTPKEPESPAKLTASVGRGEGVLELRWAHVKGARVYVIELCDDISNLTGPPAIWKQVTIVTKTKFTIADLASSVKYAFRVFAIGAGGYGAYSDTIVAKAL